MKITDCVNKPVRIDREKIDPLAHGYEEFWNTTSWSMKEILKEFKAAGVTVLFSSPRHYHVDYKNDRFLQVWTTKDETLNAIGLVWEHF